MGYHTCNDNTVTTVTFPPLCLFCMCLGDTFFLKTTTRHARFEPVSEVLISAVPPFCDAHKEVSENTGMGTPTCTDAKLEVDVTQTFRLPLFAPSFSSRSLGVRMARSITCVSARGPSAAPEVPRLRWFPSDRQLARRDDQMASSDFSTTNSSLLCLFVLFFFFFSAPRGLIYT